MSLANFEWNPRPRQLRQFAATALVVFPCIAWLWGSGQIGWTLATAGMFWSGLGLACPAVVKPLYLVLSAVALPIGWVMGEVLLALVYCLVFVPVGLTMRMIGRDPLQRRFDREAATYWQPKKPPAGPSSYLRQG
ncbi:MAG: SxtJ family membrane protein [Thermoguttaceae bacterium]|nr:SxtJ family membrane protein [Thermoguttaceae bacterium]